jgi:excisionase family DNA binding protein
MTDATLGPWSERQIRLAATIAKDEGVTVELRSDGSILVAQKARPVLAFDPPATEAETKTKAEWVPQVLTPTHLAERWHCSEQHIRNLIKKNQIKSYKLSGKLFRIPIEEVERIERDGTGPQR